jgi:DNA polymerase-3 subunit alpha
LVSAGAFDSLKDARTPGEWRGALHSSIDSVLSRAQRAKRERQQGQTGLFGAATAEELLVNEMPPAAKGWSRAELLAAEKAALGFYITGHPLESYIEVLQNLKAIRSSDLSTLNSGTRVSLGGVIAELQLRTTKKGDKFALLKVEDEAGGTKCVLWPEVYRKHASLLTDDLPVIVTGRLELSEDNPPTIIAEQVQSMEAVSRNNEFMVLRTPSQDDFPALLDSILSVLSAHPGNCDVAIETILDEQTIVRIKANSALRVSRCDELEQSLKSLGCAMSTERVTSSRV